VPTQKPVGDPDDILISFAGPAFVYESEEEHRTALTERGTNREMDADEYAAFLDARSVPHGTPARAHEAIEQMASWGIGRYYVQEYMPLDDGPQRDGPHLRRAPGLRPHLARRSRIPDPRSRRFGIVTKQKAPVCTGAF
jgi:hypothetical protein